MSLRSKPLSPIPEDTARIAQAAFRRGNPYMLLRDRPGTLFADADFGDLYSMLGQPAYAPWRLALVTPMLFRTGLSDRQVAEDARARIDWRLYRGSTHEIALVEGFVVTDKGVGHGDEASSHRDDGELSWFAGVSHGAIGLSECRAGAGGGHAGHVEGRAQARSATDDSVPDGMAPALAVMRCHAGQARTWASDRPGRRWTSRAGD